MKKRFGNMTDFNPYFGTDYGICSLIKPQLTFNDSLGKKSDHYIALFMKIIVKE